jgi:hypothetical protein
MDCCFCNHTWSIATEESTALAFSELGLDQLVAPQVQPGWWSGRVDFWLLHNAVAVQVDGSAHFAGVYRKKRMPELVQRDASFQSAAWAAGAKVVRVHHKDLRLPVLKELLQTAATSPPTSAGPFLLLSPSYREVQWRDDTGQQLTTYLDYMQQHLPSSQVVAMPKDCSVLVPGPTL